MTRFPDVLFESCSGGGGRFDPGMLFYMPQTWASDNTDAISRLRIQYGTSIVYPASSMGAHVSACPNHQVGRDTPLATRGIVAMSGTFGYELDLGKFSDEEKEVVRHQVATFKKIRPLVQNGDFFRLKSPFEGNETAWMFVSPDKGEAVLMSVHVLSTANAPFPLLKLAGLDPNRDYVLHEITDVAMPDEIVIEELGEVVPSGSPFPKGGLKLGGDALMHLGFRPGELHGDFTARMWRLRALN